MTIILYTTASEENRINKVLTTVTTLTGTLREDTNVENPYITIDMTNTQTDILKCNYAYITEFGRYYFIIDKKIINNNFIELQLRVDVLKTYATEILNNEVLIERSEFYNEPYIVDNQRMAYNFPMVLTKKFSTGFDSPHYYLTVASSVEGS